MKTDNIEDSTETDPPISKGLSEVGSPTGNNEERPLVECDKCGKKTDYLNIVGHCFECVNAKFNYG